RVSVSQGPSGVAVIGVAREGGKAIVVTPGGNALVSPHHVDEKIGAIRDAGIVLMQLGNSLNTVQHFVAGGGPFNLPVILAPSPARPLAADLLQKVAWLTPNETEIACCVPEAKNANQPDAPEIIAVLLKRCEGVVLKMGSRGAFVATRDGARQRVNAFRVIA